MTKRFLALSVSLAALAVCNAPRAAALGDHPSLCAPMRTEWQSLTRAGVPAMRDFRSRVNPNMCAALASEVDARIADAVQRQQEQARHQDELKAQASQSAAARAQLAAAEKEAQVERQARLRAEADAAEERKAREAIEAAANVPGRAHTLLACSASQDILKLDQGNIPNMRINNIEYPPEYQVVFNIADVDEGAVDAYDYDTKKGSWGRDRVGAKKEGEVITIGSSSQNDQNATAKARMTIDLQTMLMRGMVLLEPSNAPNTNVVGMQNGQLTWNLGNALNRPPRLWIEVRGNCAYQNGQPPGPLTSTADWRIVSRDIPVIPKP